MDINSVKEQIANAFLPVPFEGPVTSVDGEPFSDEIDDALSLYEQLRGRDWTSVEPSFVDFQYCGLPLLTDAAFVAFIPAWLARALDFPGADNIVREFVLYCLAGRVTDRNPDKLKLLSHEQRNALRSFLTVMSEIEPDESLRSEAATALQMINGLAIIPP
jgi:hypothetical protein